MGPWGVLQSVTDMFKILIKGHLAQPYRQIPVCLAPYLVILASMLCFRCSWGSGLQIVDFNIGIFFLLAVSSIEYSAYCSPDESSTISSPLSALSRSGAQMVLTNFLSVCRLLQW